MVQTAPLSKKASLIVPLLALAALARPAFSPRNPDETFGVVPTTQPLSGPLSRIPELVSAKLLATTAPGIKDVISVLMKAGYSLPEIAKAADQLSQVSGHLSLTQDLLREIGELDPVLRNPRAALCPIPGEIYFAPTKPMIATPNFVDPLEGPTTMIVRWALSRAERSDSGVTALDMRVKVEPVGETKAPWSAVAGGYFTDNGSISVALPELRELTTVKVSVYLFASGVSVLTDRPWLSELIVVIEPKAPASPQDSPFDTPHEIKLRNGDGVPDLVWAVYSGECVV